MIRWLMLLILVFTLAIPVSAVEFTAPPAPDSVEDLMPAETESFAEGLWEVIKAAVSALQPEIAAVGGTCLSLFAVVILISVLRELPGKMIQVVELAGGLAVAALLISGTNSLIKLSAETVTELSEYGKLLLPVMSAALAAQGGVSASTALYAGTSLFSALLSSVISKLLVPIIYLYLALSVACSTMEGESLKKLRDFLKWLTTWSLKTMLYVFTGYMGITGVVSGATDAAALKATKLTISGMIPVVGGILSDTSEAVLVGANLMKNAVGVYGLLAILAIWISPFIKIGVHYLMLKATGVLCSVFGVKRVSDLIQSISSAMALLLGMTASVCVLLMISTICMMRGIG